MNLKAFIGVFVVALLVLAAVPGSSYAEVVDPTSGNLITNLRAKYGLERGESLTTYLIEEKPESELTWKEAYLVMMSYSVSALQQDYPLNIDKAKHYGQVMLEREDSKQTRVLYYGSLSGAYYDKYKQTNDPSLIQESVKYYLKRLEEDPNSKGWSSFNWKLEKLRMHGYDVPEEAFKFSNRIWETGTWKELKTKEDLKEIGYYKWKEEQIIPLVEADKPINAKLADKLPVDKDSTIGTIFNTILWKHFVVYGVGGLFAVAIMVFGAIRVKKRAKSRRRRRH